MNQRASKKDQFQKENNGSKTRTFVALAIVAIVAAVGYFVVQDSPATTRADVQTIEAKEGHVRIPLTRIDDGRAHYFRYGMGDHAVNFFVLKSSDGQYRAAFDACDVCYHAQKGYRQEGSMMVCNNCNMAFASNQINEVKGGCNPAPLKRIVQGDDLVIAAKDIEAGSWYFGG